VIPSTFASVRRRLSEYRGTLQIIDEKAFLRFLIHSTFFTFQRFFLNLQRFLF